MSDHPGNDQTQFLLEEIQRTIQNKTAINISGGSSKNFIGLKAWVVVLSTERHKTFALVARS